LDRKPGGVDQHAAVITHELPRPRIKSAALGVPENEQTAPLNRQVGGAVGGFDAALDEGPGRRRQARAGADLGAAGIDAQKIEKHRLGGFKSHRVDVGDVVADDVQRVAVAVDAADSGKKRSCKCHEISLLFNLSFWIDLSLPLQIRRLAVHLVDH